MKTPIHDASARQHSGEPSSGLAANDGRKDRSRNRAKLDREIAGLAGQPTQELRRVWRTFYHTGPPLGLSRDLIIRGVADKLQLRAHGGASRALQRRVRILEDEFEKGVCSFDHRSLTVIAERITGAHWSGPRFFGLGKQMRAF